MQRVQATPPPFQPTLELAQPEVRTAEGPLVVALDGREHDADALALAHALQGVFGGELLIAHVIPPPPLADRVTDYALVARRSGHELLARAAARPGPAVQTRLLESWPAATALAQLADDERAWMIVLGSSHRGAVGSIMPGRTASRLVAGTRRQVAIAPKGFARTPAAVTGPIGLAYDASREADVALDAAIGAARRLDVPLRLYHAVRAVSEDPSWDLFRAKVRRVAEETLGRGRSQVPPGVPVSTVVLDGDAAAAISQASSRDCVGLLYVGSRGYGPLREAIAHGFGGGVQATARCPLVIVPPGWESVAPARFRRSAALSAYPEPTDGHLLGGSSPQHRRARRHRLGPRALRRRAVPNGARG